MATTAETVFKIAMGISDEIPDTGLFTSSDLESYKVRTPYILTMLEAELLKEGEIFNTYTLTDAAAPFTTATDAWVTIPMPDDFKSLVELNTLNKEGHYFNVEYRWQDKNSLIFPAQFKGTLNIVYHAVPTVIASLADTLHVDDITARTLLPYALAAELFKMENEDIYQYASQRYQQLKAQTVKQVKFDSVIDYYGR
jgi:hypothetical protein